MDWIACVQARVVAAAGAAALASLAPFAALAGDAASGEEIARTWCSACHIVADDQTSGSVDVPTFRTIAQQRGYTAADLRTFLANPHPKMPPMSLTRREIDDIVAYLDSLKTPD